MLGYVYCLPVVGQVEDKVVRKGNPRLEYTDVKTGRSPEGKMFTVSFNIVESTIAKTKCDNVKKRNVTTKAILTQNKM